MSSRIIFGIDPGIGRTGFGVVRESAGKFQLLDYGCIETPPGLAKEKRLEQIVNDLKELLHQWKPKACAVEQIFFAKNSSTAIDVSHARGVILLTIEQAGIPLAEYTPPQIKLAVTGVGNADKYQVKQMVKTILGMKRAPTPDDAADALAIALCNAMHNEKLTPITGI